MGHRHHGEFVPWAKGQIFHLYIRAIELKSSEGGQNLVVLHHRVATRCEGHECKYCAEHPTDLLPWWRPEPDAQDMEWDEANVYEITCGSEWSVSGLFSMR